MTVDNCRCKSLRVPVSDSPLIPVSHLLRRPEPERRLRLLERVRRAIRTRHYSPRTEEAYCDWVRRFVVFHDRRHPMLMGEREISAFLTHLATVNKVSASTQNQALHALLFLYRIVMGQPMGVGMQFPRAKRPQRLPVVLSPREVRNVIGQMAAVPRLCATLMYGSGLRVSECVALRVKDVDFDRTEILVQAGKGNKDRRVPLPVTVMPELRRHLEASDVPFAAAFLCDSPVGRGRGHQDHSGIAGPFERADDDDLHACAEQGRAWCSKSC